jgi:LCP family protein required for cell wall assembly
MSEEWPNGWYRDEPRQQARPSFTPRPDDQGSPDDATQAVPGGTTWPAQPPARGWPGDSEPPPTRGPRGPYRPRGWRRWLRPKRILLTLVALVLVLAAAAVGLYFNLNSKLSRVNVLVPTGLTSAGTNWLIAGSDSRGGLTRTEEDQLALGHDISGGRTDTIMLLHLPSNGTRPTLVSIPRDSYVPIPGHGSNKINAAYSLGGPKLLIQTVQNVTGLRIDHYMAIGFGGLVDVVNDVGGVRLCLPGPLKDPKAGLNLKKGCQTLNGGQALGFVRTREFPLGDLQREQDQRALLKSLLSKMTSAGTLINPFAVIPAARGAASSITVDQGTSLPQLVSVAFALRNPVTTMVPFGGFGSTSAGSVVQWNVPEAKAFFHDLATDTPLPRSLVTGAKVTATS